MARITLFLLSFMLFSLTADALEVTDMLGRKVEVPQKVERLIALGSSMSFVTYLGAQGLAVGVEDMDKLAKYAKPYIQANYELVKDLPVVGKGGAVRIPDYERIIRLKPDILFIISTDAGEPDLIQKKLNIPVIALSYGMPSFSIGSFTESLLLAGRVLGRKERALELVDYINSLEARLPKRTEPAVSAYIGGISFRGNQGIESTAADFLPMKMAGITNSMDSERRRGQFFINKEFLLVKDPEIIFIDSNGLGIVADDVKRRPDFYKRLQAFRNGKVFLLPPHATYFINPEIMLANAFLMAKSAYPSQYEDIDPEVLTDEIVSRFNGKGMYRFLKKTGVGYGRLELTEAGLAVK